MLALITKARTHASGSLEDGALKPQVRVQSYLWAAILSPAHGLGCAVRFCSALLCIHFRPCDFQSTAGAFPPPSDSN